MRVLLVEDNDALRTALRDMLEREGYHVLEESNGNSALAVVAGERPDVMILDHHIPGLMGVDLLLAVRQRRPDLPVVLMSAFADPTTIAEALRLDRTRYLGKPFRARDLLREIRRLTADP